MVVQDINIMKRKLLLLLLLLLSILFIHNSMLIYIDVVCLIIYLFVIVTWIIYMRHCQKITPDFLIDLKRDYEYIHVGTRRLYENRGLDLANLNRNFYTDIKIIERFYSLIKENGYISMEIKNDRNYIIQNKISPFDYCLMHPVVVYSESYYKYKYVYKYKEIFTGIYYFFIKYIIKRDKLDNCNYVELNKFISKLYDLSEFAKERGLLLQVELKDFDEKYIDKIKQCCDNINLI